MLRHVAVGVALAGLLLTCSACILARQSTARVDSAPARVGDGIHTIQHVIIIMQENRSFDSYFGAYPGADGIPLGGRRLDPPTDGRPDPRPDVRENAPQLGDLTRDFDFNQPPRPPLILPIHPRTTLIPPGVPAASPGAGP